MTPDQLALGFLQYVVFLLSTTCHEAAHALVAKMGGDLTAFEGGQVTLNPLPHIKREPFGMVLMPLLGIATGSGLIGWASAPYDPMWSIRHPKRAGLMSLAGPATNFIIAILAAMSMRIGLMMGTFTRGELTLTHIVSAPAGSVADGVATVLSTFFTLNILLGIFNLIPFPPLDGYGALGLIASEDFARKLIEWRFKFRGIAILGLVLGWRIVDQFYYPTMSFALHLVYPRT